jgi:hypothetical protein
MFKGRYNKGYMRTVRELKHEEAVARNAKTPPERRKANRKAKEES